MWWPPLATNSRVCRVTVAGRSPQPLCRTTSRSGSAFLSYFVALLCPELHLIFFILVATPRWAKSRCCDFHDSPTLSYASAML